MFKGSVLFEISFLDQKYFLYFEESDFCLRAVRKGLKLLYYPGSRIVHTGGLIAEGNWQRFTGNYLDSFAYYFTKNYGPAARRAA